MIEARSLEKAYGREVVLDGAELSVPARSSIVLTGENGSGKSTLLHILVGLRRPDAGEVRWKGSALRAGDSAAWRRARSAWGFLPQALRLPPDATVAALGRFHAGLRDSERGPMLEWVERVGLGDALDVPTRELSGGMLQRLGIALALFHRPELVVMDEPAGSLDPAWRSRLAAWLAEVTERGGGVVVASQLPEWAAEGSEWLRCEGGRVVRATGEDPA